VILASFINIRSVKYINLIPLFNFTYGFFLTGFRKNRLFMLEPRCYFEKIRRDAEDYLENNEVELLGNAFALAEESHQNQRRDSGEPYILHPLAVTDYLVQMRLDGFALAAALLHDVPEDTQTTLDTIRQQFGNEIAQLVDGVTKLGQFKPPPGTSEELLSVFGQADTLDKMMKASAEDVRVILIKLADRLHNMRTILALPNNRRKKVVNSTLKIYIPIAVRLGIWSMKREMEDHVLQALKPDTYTELIELIEEQKEHRAQTVTNVSQLVQHRLADWGIASDSLELPLGIAEFYQLPKKYNLFPSKEIDVIGICILVPNVKDCYTAVGAVHSLWKPVPGKQDDYVVSPKENTYRSIHTTVVGPGGSILKVRIRTREMHEWAEYGLYAFYRNRDTYKKLGKPEDRVKWLGEIIKWGREYREYIGPDEFDIVETIRDEDLHGTRDQVTSTERDPLLGENASIEFVESLLSDFLPEHIDIFTPKGKVIELPKDSTPIDFAYAIHTNIGHSCRAAQINGRYQALNQPLRNGDQVYILTVPHPEPVYEWLNPYLGFVKTSYARRAIRRWFKRQSEETNRHRGKQTLDHEFQLLGMSNVDYQQLGLQLGFANGSQFILAVGSANYHVSKVIVQFVNMKLGLIEHQSNPVDPGITIQCPEGFKVRLGKCCNPVPGASIMGIAASSGQLTVHRIECKYALKAISEGKIIAVSWQDDEGFTKPVSFVVEAYDRPDLLKDFTNIVGQELVNMEQVIATKNDSGNRATINAILRIPDGVLLLRILHRIEKLPNVQIVFARI
jgi:(p)ppGpp synthase/HD superfamily hydrolase